MRNSARALAVLASRINRRPRPAAPSRLLLSLVRRSSFLLWHWLGERWAALRRWSAGRRKETAAHVQFEPLEPRLLLSGDLMPLAAPPGAEVQQQVMENAVASETSVHVQGLVYQWKNHTLLGGVTVQGATASAVAASTDLFDLRSAQYSAADNSVSVQVWANPAAAARSMQFTVHASGGTAAFTSALDPAWTVQVQEPAEGGLQVSATLPETQPGVTGALQLGLLKVTMPAGGSNSSVDFSAIGVGSSTAAAFGIGLAGQVTGANGEVHFMTLPAGSYGLGASRGSSDTGSAITSADALAALRIAVGINPNPDPDADGPLVAPKLSPYQVIAADVNEDGRVSSADALAVLRTAVKLPIAPAPVWHLVPERQDLWDRQTNASALTRLDATWNRSLDRDLAHDAQLNIVGVLRGDVNGSWVPPASSSDLDQVRPNYFDELSARLGVPTDAWGVADADFTRDQRSPAITSFGLAPAFDTGTPGDGITAAAQVTLTGSTEAEAQVTLKRGTMTLATMVAAGDGSFRFRGVALEPGANGFEVVVTDPSGNTASRAATVTHDSSVPAIASFDLAAASDTSPPGDRTTTEERVTLEGVTEAGARLTLALGAATVGTATAGEDGKFSFGNVALAVGANEFSLTAQDAAGNTTSRSYTFTRASLVVGPPQLSVALQADTGRSASDGTTREAAVTGSAVDETSLSGLEVALDPGAEPVFTSIMDRRQPDGSFTLSQAQLATLAGGTLADGTHTLRVRAIDGEANATVRELVFTLDTQGPGAATIGISSADALLGTDDQTAAAIVQLLGTAEVDADVSLAAQGLSARAGAGGQFVLPGVSLALGANELTFTVADAAGNSRTVTRTFTRVQQTSTDQVLRWNELALRAIQLDVTDVPVATRVLAMQNLAVYDALAAIEGTPAYLVARSVTGPVSADAAAAVAAHRILALHYPAQKPGLDSALASSLAQVADGAAKDAGIALGLSIADAVWALRQQDGASAFTIYPGGTQAGQWRPEAPMYLVADDPHWKSVTPFALAAGSALRPAAPPALDTVAYAQAVEEVKRLGSATSTERTADQTEQALFWADGPGSYTPPGHWNQIAVEIAQARGNSLSANARLFAQLNVALADAAIACWDAKYTYGLWRPETAIHNADADANAGTTVDAAWRPLLLTPPHPEYVSGHSSFSAAAGAILAAAFGENTSFSTTSATLPGVARSFTSFTQAVQEAGRSRILGGIHYEFTNQAGQALGRAVADAVLQRFAVSEDRQAPSVVVEATLAASATNVTLQGQVLDNLSGVASAQFRLDEGPLQDLVLGTNGSFTLTTALALDGSADGTHTLTFIARDAAGNISAGLTRSFVLDTQAPAVTLTTIPDNFTLVAGTRLTGTADAGISGLTLLNYSIDNGTTRGMTFGAGGTFDDLLQFATLDVGDHTLRVTARDAAGNTTTVQRAVKIEALAPLSVASLTPSSGAVQIGVTERPQVRFSRPVNVATLTAESFYATGPDGQKLAATIVPANDGSYAWLFFDPAMPGGSLVTVTLDGSKIRAAADGSFLDGDGDGVAGGMLSASFTTVSTTTLSGTKIVGRVVDPGPDLEPMTFDDIRRGPDGIIHTPDDVFMLPIANAKVFILGREDQFVFTDAEGRFELDGVPAGTVKLAVDGRTATNPPAGVFFPEMVLDVELKGGVTNTVMGGMGTLAQRQANADRQEIYLPRVQQNALQTVSATQATVITVTDAASAPQLSDTERAALTLTVQPGSAIGDSGQVLQDVKIGVSTVPPELVRDMLPPGVLEHTFDITIQAPGVATFAQPVQITLPNVFNAAPGSKLNILSFDHTTGRLVINGTGTVSADGLVVVSDPDSGIRAPGWHGLTPPGGPSDPPCPPGTPHDVEVPPVPVTSGLQDRFYKDDQGQFTLSFGNAAQAVDPSRDPCDPVNMRATPLVVQIKLDGPAAEFLDGLADQTFELLPQQQKNIQVSVKDLLANIKTYLKDVLYGTTIEVKAWKSSDPGTLLINQKNYVYRFVDSLDASLADAAGAFHADGIVMMPDTINDGADGVVRRRPLELKTGSETPALTIGNADFPDPTATGFRFDPRQTSANKAPLEATITIRTPAGGTAGTLKISGEATPVNTINFNEADLKAAITAAIADAQTAGGDVERRLFTLSESGLFDTQAKIDAFATSLITAMQAKFTSVASLNGGYAFGTATNEILFNWATSTATEYATSKPSAADDGVDLRAADVFNAIKNGSFASFNAGQQDFIVSDLINQSQKTGVNVYIDNILEYQGKGETAAQADPMSMSIQQVLNAFAKTAVHEAVHTLGMPHSAQSYLGVAGAKVSEVQTLTRTGGAAGNTFKLHFQGFDTADLPFDANAAAIQAALTGLLSIGAGNLTVAAGANANQLTLTFGGALTAYDPPLITVTTTGALSANIVQTVQGDGKAGLYAGVPNGTLDLMHGGFLDYAGTLTLQPDLSANALKVGMAIDWDHTHIEKLIQYWTNHLTAGGVAKGVALAWYDSIEGPDTDIAEPVYEGPALAAQVQGTGITGATHLGDLTVDGTTRSASRTVSLFNLGKQNLVISSISLAGGGGQFTLVGNESATLAAGGRLDVEVRFQATQVGPSGATLQVRSNDPDVGVMEIPFTARVGSVAPRLSLSYATNNVGGQGLAAGAKVVDNFVTLRNDGQQDLAISAIALDGSDAAFRLRNTPVGLSAVNPLILAAGQSRQIGISFDPSTAGLARTVLRIASNDASSPETRLSVVGTGTVAGQANLHWGNDRIALREVNRAEAPVLRTVSDSGGGWSFFLPPETAVQYTMFDPISGLVSHSYDMTAPTGERTSLIGSLFAASTAPDSDGDGLPDDIEFSIGSNQGSRDTDRDGLDDFTEIQQGLDPLGGLGVPTGITAAVTLQGSAEAVAVFAPPGSGLVATALVATGSHGLATVDVSQFMSPRVLAQLDLSGTSTDVAVDAQRQLAVLAANEAGLHIVDVSDPAAPRLLQTIAFGASVRSVEVRDGTAYVAAGNAVSAVDLVTGEVRTTVTPGGTGGSALMDMAVEGSTLYVLDGSNTLRVIAIEEANLVVRGALALPAGGGRVFAGGGIAYVGAGNGSTGGYMTVDVSDPASPTLLSGVDNNAVAGTAIVANGSGLAIGVGSSSFVFGGFRALDVFSAADPANTNNFVTRIDLPEVPKGLALANGLAFVAGGSAGLQVVNYAAFDTGSAAPTVTITAQGTDVDPGTPGVQVLEGRTIRVLPTVGDDVQVRNVQLLVNGQVVATDVAFPWEMLAQAPTIANGGNTITLQVRATDTGGNVGLSNVLTLDVVPDTFPPQVTSVSVDDGERRFFVRSVEVTFDEPLDTSRFGASTARLVRAGADGQFGTGDDDAVAVRLDTRNFGQLLGVVVDGVLPAGDYRFTLEAASIADRAGNLLGADVVRGFTIRPASEVRAGSGVPEFSTAPSANPGQQIGIPVPFDPATARAQFAVVDDSGNRSTRVVNVVRTDATRGVAFFTVPLDAVTGDAVVFSQVGTTRTDFADGTFQLQVVPVVLDVQVESLSGDGSTAQVLLAGYGFVEGNASEYRFGTETVVDTVSGSGPDVFGRSDPVQGFIPNGYARVTVTLSDGVFGPVATKTAGGTSAAFSVSVDAIGAVALRGTPANAAQASANPGQAVTLQGTGLTPATDVLLRWTNTDGNPQMSRLNPTSVSTDGTRASVIIPRDANGVARLQVFGSTSQPLLQIVPVLDSFDVSGNQLTLTGAGFVEGASTYTFAGATLTDDNPDGATDVYWNPDFSGQNGRVFFNGTATRHGFGNVTVTTAGGTSDPLLLNVLRLQAEGTTLGDVAVAPNGDVWTSDYTSPGHVLRINPATGDILQSLTLSNEFGTPYMYNHAGLQVVGAMTLGSTAVPAGSLLVFNGYPSPDRVIAVDPATGAVLASLAVDGNYDLTAGVYDAATQHLLLLENNGPGNRLIELDAVTGALVGAVTLPVNIQSHAGLAIDPVSGNLWVGSYNERWGLVEVTRAGQEVRRLDLRSQGVTENEVSGLAFAPDGALLVASTHGVIYRVQAGVDHAAIRTATLTQVVAGATNGVAANGAQASANVGQVIELLGSNFGPGTRVLFETRDPEGNRRTVAVSPLVIDRAGTLLQVLVPEQATTGEVRVVNQGWRDLGFSGYADAVYRKLTVTFTANGPTASVRFADAGLQDLNDESWGIDNVRVSAGDSTVFADDFESGSAAAAWGSAPVESSQRSAFSRFLGRLNNAGQTLALTGLTAGQAYTLSFDLLVLDSWDGASRSVGPDMIDVSVDGTSLLRETVANIHAADTVQTLRATPGLRLQIVPTLTATEGRPGEDNTFTLVGSGFMEGASTVTVAGVAIADVATNLFPLDVSGQRNDRMSVVAPRTLDGPIRITTEGGYAQLAGPTLPQVAPTQFTGIVGQASGGRAADEARPAANTGQAIVLQGQGFTSSTLVQFQGVDDAGVAGTLTRTGSVGNNGTTLTVVVPALARTGNVTVLGSGASLALQVVPTLRAVSGTVAAGNTLLMEGSGLVAPELVVTVGGRPVGNFTVRTIVDGSGETRDQQLLTLVVPVGTAGEEVLVSTAGGTSSNRRGIVFTDLGVQAQATDPGDTLASAVALGTLRDAQVAATATIGDGVEGTREVDLYALQLDVRTTLRVGLASTDLSSRVRIFNAAGTEVAARSFGFNDSNQLVFTASATGTYYVGVSGSGNNSYNPNVAGSGTAADTGSYRLNLEAQRGGSSRLSGIVGTAASGIAAQSTLPSANTGQQITLAGVGLVASDRVVFTTIDGNGNLGELTVAPGSVDVTAQMITVTVPDSATTGRVRLERDQVGLLLQVVPTVSDVAMNPGSNFLGSTLTLRGSGFAEAATAVLFGAQRVEDRSPGSDINVFGSSGNNNVLNLTVPATSPSLPAGPLRVSTVGGTSAAFGLALTGITATASSGVPADAGQASAVPGQMITLHGSGFDASTDFVFQVVDSEGSRVDVVVHPAVVSADGTQAQVAVPLNGTTGAVRAVGDSNGAAVALQVLPVVSDVQVEFVPSDGRYVQLLLAGFGFSEANASEYRFGAESVVDAGAGTGPDVFDRSDPLLGYVRNGYVRVFVPFTDQVFGPISVRTLGGTSGAFSVSLDAIEAVALRGTPATLGQASANPGQAITLQGVGLSTETDVLLRWTNTDGNLQVTRLNPSSASADGTRASITIPRDANGVARLQVFGSANQPLLQIVPVIDGFEVSGTQLTLTGAGFVEGASSYAFSGLTVNDQSTDGSTDVYWNTDFSGQNGRVFFNNTATRHGFGNVTVTTAGGTSDPFALGLLRLQGEGTTLGDVAVAPNGDLWASDYTSPGHLLRLSAVTGEVLQTITLTNEFGTPYSYNHTGLQFVGAMTLGTTAVPAGSLLVFNGYPSPDMVVAVDPATGAVLGSLQVDANYDLTAGVYDAATQHLFLLENNGPGSRMIELDAVTGAQVAAVTLPLNIQSHAGLAIDPSSGNLWVGSYSERWGVVEVTRAGQEVRRLDLRTQGVNDHEISGLAFAQDGALLVASTHGVIYRVQTGVDAAAIRTATLTQVVGSATLGTAANGAQASANVGQVIELRGTNFGPGTRVLFETLNGDGTRQQVAVSPTLIDAAGTRMQVLVPDQATTGQVRVVNQGWRDLGFSGNADAVYRNLAVTFTAGGATASVRFADTGLQDLNDESWGLDNVRVSTGGNTVFSDDFESGAAAAAWGAGAPVDASQRTAFTRFLGRLNNGAQTLGLTGLTAGQSYTVTFDLLVLDTWDGAQRSFGPDQFEVSVDGTTLLREAVSNTYAAESVQTLRATPGLRLQIVPTLRSMEGRPGEDNTFTLVGSGFIEGASTVTVGGVVLADTATNLFPLDVSGQRNDRMTVAAPKTLDGPVRITTEGGHAQLPGPGFPPQPLSQLAGISALATFGIPAQGGLPSANTGQAIVLQGQGFTNSTLVQFQGVDDAGATGTLTRTGSAGNNGTTLTVVVPALARSGAVTVLGSGNSVQLQVVPTLRAVGGTIAAGNTLVLEGSGLVGPELQVTIGGQVASSFSVRTIVDGGGETPDQQLVVITVPTGASGEEVLVTTAGGRAANRRGITIANQGEQAQASDPADTLAGAVALGQLRDARVTATASIGDGTEGTRDVDLYALELDERSTLRVTLASTDLSSRVRVLDAAGAEVAARSFGFNDANQLVFTATVAGTYHVGVSGSGNNNYNPTVAGSGVAADTGSYRLTLEAQRGSSSRLGGISSSASSGTAAQAGVPSANTGQLITLAGVGLLASDRVVFTTIDGNGNLGEVTVAPASVDLPTQTITVTVPDTATTGRLRLEREQAGLVLQVVPTVTDVSMNPGGSFVGSTLSVRGSGFAEAAVAVHFGGLRVDDRSPNFDINVFGSSGNNNMLNLTVPATSPALPAGPIRVSTAGGTSAAFGLALTGMDATATSGVPADAGQASATPGQVIMLHGTGLDTSLDVVFQTTDSEGNRGEVVVRPTTASADGMHADVKVPMNAITGVVRVVGDSAGSAILLQVLPVVLDAQVEFVASDGSVAQVLLSGFGFVEGQGSEYRMGSQLVLDPAVHSGPDVFGRSDATMGFVSNGFARVTVPLSEAAFGPITVRTAGGTSAGFTVNVNSVTSTAARGTPADAGQASANPGQTVTLNGTGLTTETDVLLRWTNIDGNTQVTRLNPASAAADGTSATLVIPRDANGVARLQVFGSTSQPPLQIVPVLDSFDVSGTQLTLVGAGFVEGGSTYAFSGRTLVDGSTDGSTDVYWNPEFSGQNGRVFFNNTLASHGFGDVTVTTAGGTSNPLALNVLRVQAEGTTLGDVAVAANGDLWTSDYTSPGHLLRVSATTGAILQTITLTDAFGTPYSYNHSGLQVVGAMTLGTTAVPAGSLLVFNGYPNPDRVVAVNPATGAVLGSLVLDGNYDLTAGVYDATTQHLFILEQNGPGNRMIELDAVTGAQVAAVTLPVNIQSHAGIAIDPVTGNLWVGSYSSRWEVIELTRTGTEVRRLDLRSQGVTENEISGLAFAADGALLVASTHGVVYRVSTA